MARSRDYRAEYRRRVELGRERGLSTYQARGHARDVGEITAREALRRGIVRPPQELVRAAKRGRYPDATSPRVEQFEAEAPDWISRGIDRELLPHDAAVLIQDALLGRGITSAPDPDRDHVTIFHQPGGPWTVILTRGGRRAVTVDMPMGAAWNAYGWAKNAGFTVRKRVTTPSKGRRAGRRR